MKRTVKKVVESEPALLVGLASAVVGAFVMVRLSPDSGEAKAALAAAVMAFAQAFATRALVFCERSLNRILGRPGGDGRIPDGPRG